MSAIIIQNHLLEDSKSRKKADFVHLVFASINFYMMFLASLSIINYIVFLISLLLLSSTLYAIFLYYLKIRNHFFIIFNYGSTICTLFLYLDFGNWSYIYYTSDFFIFISIALPYFFFLPIIIYFIYLLTLIKTSGTSTISRKLFIAKYGGSQAYGQERINEMWQDDAVDVFNSKSPGTTFDNVAKLRDELKKKYNMYKILLITIILTISFLTVYIYATII